MSKYIKWLIRIVCNTVLVVLGFCYGPIHWAYGRDETFSTGFHEYWKDIRNMGWGLNE